MDRGINELFEGVTITRGENKIILPPSSFAEAQIALTKPGQLRQNLEEMANILLSDETLDFPATRSAAKKHGNRLYEALEERIRKDNEGSLHLLDGNPVISEGFSGGGILYVVVKRRGDERKARHRDVTIVLDGAGNIAKLACQCPTYLRSSAKSNYGRMVSAIPPAGGGVRSAHPRGISPNGLVDSSGFPSFDVNVACYHIAVALTYAAKEKRRFCLPFNIEAVYALEALLMDKLSKEKKAAIDDYLIGKGVITEETQQKISNGEMTLEVAKHMKNIDGRAKEIIRRIKERREKEGYFFSGFATDFRGTSYKTASIVLTKSDGRSVHILHDTKLGIDLPLVMLNVPANVWVENLGREPVRTEIPENPLQSLGRYVNHLDERTQREVVSIITRPEREILNHAEAAAYAGLVQRQPALL